jgi:glycine/D-amino acid oxidase-like deaminating enzyme
MEAIMNTDASAGTQPISLWWDQLPSEMTAPLGTPLDGDVDCDVAIVGGGYTGLWTAYYLQQTDPAIRICVIEANVAGFGASGRNGGWASALFPASLRQLAERSDRETAVRMKRTMHATVEEIGRVSSAEGWDVEWSRGGTIGVARSALQLQRAEEEIADMRAWGFGPEDYSLLTKEESLGVTRMSGTLGATFTPHCAAVNPARLVRSLAATVASRGVRILEQTPATSIESGAVRTTRGSVRAPIVVRATEGYTPSLAGHKRVLAPVYSLMLATEPLSDDAWAQIGLDERQTFHDGRNLIIYGQRTADGRFAFGGRGAPYHFGSRIDPAQDRNASVHAALREVLVELFPSVSDAQITHTWGGPLGIARDWWASVGLDRSTGLAWAGGYVGDGVGTSNLSGRTLADLILERATDLTTLPWVDHRSRQWEPEPLRWLGTNLGLQVMTKADAKEQRTGRESRLAGIFARKIGH